MTHAWYDELVVKLNEFSLGIDLLYAVSNFSIVVDKHWKHRGSVYRIVTLDDSERALVKLVLHCG